MSPRTFISGTRRLRNQSNRLCGGICCCVGAPVLHLNPNSQVSQSDWTFHMQYEMFTWVENDVKAGLYLDSFVFLVFFVTCLLLLFSNEMNGFALRNQTNAVSPMSNPIPSEENCQRKLLRTFSFIKTFLEANVIR